jgi:RNA polymerase sigma-70 factor (ECF subfamily)
MDLGPSGTAGSTLDAGLPEHAWIQPVPDAWVLSTGGDPAELVAERESVRLAFVAALQHLPPRQRAALVLKEVLRWSAAEVADLLDTSVASVNSALQRARATLADIDADPDTVRPSPASTDDELVGRFVDAFERYDVGYLVSLLHADVVQSMPPYALWLRGPEEVGRWLLGQGIGCRGSRLVPTAANGGAAFGSYRPSGPNTWHPFALQVIETADGRISGFHNFLYPELFRAFGLPDHLSR